MGQQHQNKMRHLVEQADTSGDGLVSQEEFENVFRDQSMKLWLSAQEIDVGDIALIFDLIDNGDGKLTCAEICHGMSLLKGPARSFDVYGMMHMIKNVSSVLENIEAKLEI